MNSQNGALTLRLVLFSAATLIFFTCVQSVRSAVYVYNSFGPGNTFVTYADWGIQGASASGGYVGHGELFVPTLSGNLQSVQLALVTLSGGTSVANFYVAANNGGTPGPVLASFMNVVAPASSSGSFLVTLNSVTQPLLQAGTTYWLYGEPAASTTAIGWLVNNQGYANNYAQENPPGVWTSGPVTFGANGVFDVSVTPVPEPSIAGLLILGAGCFFIRRKRGSLVHTFA